MLVYSNTGFRMSNVIASENHNMSDIQICLNITGDIIGCTIKVIGLFGDTRLLSREEIGTLETVKMTELSKRKSSYSMYYIEKL